jgi:hypothetical protein
MTPHGIADIAVANQTTFGADIQPLDGMTHLAKQDDDACRTKDS